MSRSLSLSDSFQKLDLTISDEAPGLRLHHELVTKLLNTIGDLHKISSVQKIEFKLLDSPVSYGLHIWLLDGREMIYNFENTTPLESASYHILLKGPLYWTESEILTTASVRRAILECVSLFSVSKIEWSPAV